MPRLCPGYVTPSPPSSPVAYVQRRSARLRALFSRPPSALAASAIALLLPSLAPPLPRVPYVVGSRSAAYFVDRSRVLGLFVSLAFFLPLTLLRTL